MDGWSRKSSCRYLDELIELLDEEADTRDCRHRPQLIRAMRDLELQACLAGASALTVSMIHASQMMILVGEMRPSAMH